MTQTEQDGTITIRQPTIFLDLAPASTSESVPDNSGLPGRNQAEAAIYAKGLQPLLKEIQQEREKEISTISDHMEISLNAIIDRQQVQFANLMEQKESGSNEPGLEGRLRMVEDRMDELNNRLDTRRLELERMRQCTISNIQHHGAAWVLPPPGKKYQDW